MAFASLTIPLEANVLQETHCHIKASILFSPNYHLQNPENVYVMKIKVQPVCERVAITPWQIYQPKL